MTWHLNCEPYEVQTTALKLAEGKKGFGYFLEQGLGKTAVILNEITDLFMKDEIACAMGFMPKTLMHNWKDEAEKMGFKGQIFIWDELPPVSKLPDRDFILLMNFEATITSRGEDYLDEFYGRYSKNTYTFVDESSKIKNHKAKRTLQILSCCFRSGYTRVATGTPVTQSVADLWSQLRAIGAVSMRFYPFKHKFCVLGGYLGKQIIGAKNLDQLQAMMKPTTMVAKKKDWTDLPDKIYISRKVALDKCQISHYKKLEEQFLTVVNQEVVSVNMAISLLQKLQQVVSGFVHGEDGKVIPLFKSPTQIPKIQALIDVQEEVQGKSIIFCVHKYSIDIIMEALKDYNPAYIRGGMTSEERKEQRDKFNNDPACRVVVCQIQSGGIGLTLLGQPGDDRCSTTIFYENDFSLENRLQGEDRNHRHGQDTPVSYYDLFSTGVNLPIEGRAITALQRKEQLANAIQDPLIKRRA